MLPPVLEVYVVWHPGDDGASVADELVGHFHGDAYSGLIGGAIEVFIRSEHWDPGGGAPRPLPVIESLPHGLRGPEYTVVVPLVGLELAAAVEHDADPWRGYIEAIVDARARHPGRVAVVPVRLAGAPGEGQLAELVGGIQAVGVDQPELCRDVAQAIAQFVLGGDARLRVFISHTKHPAGDDRVGELIEQVRREIASTRLDDFFDEHDLQTGRDWAPDLIRHAATSALLAVRTDLYASRTWCQREFLVAKRKGMPVAILDALDRGEDRGSFLMDHVPRVPVGADAGASIRAVLGRLVDECLKRALWREQRRLAEQDGVVDVAWWAAHAPEPLTMLAWLEGVGPAGAAGEPLLVLHPDPPLGEDELAVLRDLVRAAGLDGRLEVLTPRALAGRGG